MNLRTLLIIAVLALPIVVFAILSQSGTQSPKTQQAPQTPATPAASNPVAAPPPAAPQAAAPAIQQPPAADVTQTGGVSAPSVLLPPLDNNSAAAAIAPTAQVTLDQAREKVKSRLAELEKLTPAQWPEERKKHPNAPATLQQALDYNRNRLSKLSSMTESQWETEQQTNAAKAQKWNELNPQQRVELIEKQQQRLQDLKQEVQQPAASVTNSPDAPAPASLVPVPTEMPAPAATR
jgi:Skp family chaperone for outer membrane proteins